MMSKKIKTILVLSIICFAAFFSSASLATNKKDIKTLTRAIGFMQGGPVGDVKMAIIYDPYNDLSVAHANEVIDAIRNSDNKNKVRLTGEGVSFSSMEKVDAKVIFITKGMDHNYAAILKRAKELSAITVSTVEDCLTNGGCVLVVKTEPDVDILVNTNLAKEMEIEFSIAFNMMITKR